MVIEVEKEKVATLSSFSFVTQSPLSSAQLNL